MLSTAEYWISDPELTYLNCVELHMPLLSSLDARYLSPACNAGFHLFLLSARSFHFFFHYNFLLVLELALELVHGLLTLKYHNPSRLWLNGHFWRILLETPQHRVWPITTIGPRGQMSSKPAPHSRHRTLTDIGRKALNLSTTTTKNLTEHKNHVRPNIIQTHIIGWATVSTHRPVKILLYPILKKKIKQVSQFLAFVHFHALDLT